MFSVDPKYYSGENLLKQKDIDGNRPGIFLSNSNRSAGKSTFFTTYLIDRFVSDREKFIILMRDKSEIENVDVCFEETFKHYYSDKIMSIKYYVNKLVMGIWLDTELAGFSISLKDATKLKKYSAIFDGVINGLFDELQPENGRYLKEEIDLFTSIIKTVSRGGGEQSRYMRWILISNNITVMNPYFLNMGIYKYVPEKLDLSEGDFYVKGNGYVCEFSFNRSAADAMEENPALKCFNTANNRLGVSADFMINSNAFIMSKLGGKNVYLYTLKYKEKMYAVRQSEKKGIVFVSKNYDPGFRTVIALTAQDHNELTLQLQYNTFHMAVLRDSYMVGRLRFSDLEVKNDIIELLGIDLYKDR